MVLSWSFATPSPIFTKIVLTRECMWSWIDFRRRHFRHSRSSNVIDFGTNRKRVCDFLFVRHSNLDPILHSCTVSEILQAFMCSWPHAPLFHLNFGCVPVAPSPTTFSGGFRLGPGGAQAPQILPRPPQIFGWFRNALFLLEGFWGPEICLECVGGCGFAPDPAGGAHDAPQIP